MALALEGKTLHLGIRPRLALPSEATGAASKGWGKADKVLVLSPAAVPF